MVLLSRLVIALLLLSGNVFAQTSGPAYRGDVSAKRINNVRKCDQFTGATAGAKIIACLADLPATGGLADASGLEGNQSITTGVTVSSGYALKMGGAAFTCTASPCVTIDGGMLYSDTVPTTADSATPGATLQGSGKTLIKIIGHSSVVRNIRARFTGSSASNVGILIDGQGTDSNSVNKWALENVVLVGSGYVSSRSGTGIRLISALKGEILNPAIEEFDIGIDFQEANDIRSNANTITGGGIRVNNEGMRLSGVDTVTLLGGTLEGNTNCGVCEYMGGLHYSLSAFGTHFEANAVSGGFATKDLLFTGNSSGSVITGGTGASVWIDAGAGTIVRIIATKLGSKKQHIASGALLLDDTGYSDDDITTATGGVVYIYDPLSHQITTHGDSSNPFKLTYPVGADVTGTRLEVDGYMKGNVDSSSLPGEGLIRMPEGNKGANNGLCFKGSGFNACLVYNQLAGLDMFSMNDPLHVGMIYAGDYGDLLGTVAVVSASSATYSFTHTFTTRPVCTLTPLQNPGSTTWWVDTSTTVLTVHLSTSDTLSFFYHCIGAY